MARRASRQAGEHSRARPRLAPLLPWAALVRWRRMLPRLGLRLHPRRRGAEVFAPHQQHAVQVPRVLVRRAAPVARVEGARRQRVRGEEVRAQPARGRREARVEPPGGRAAPRVPKVLEASRRAFHALPLRGLRLVAQQPRAVQHLSRAVACPPCPGRLVRPGCGTTCQSPPSEAERPAQTGPARIAKAGRAVRRSTGAEIFQG